MKAPEQSQFTKYSDGVRIFAEPRTVNFLKKHFVVDVSM